MLASIGKSTGQEKLCVLKGELRKIMGSGVILNKTRTNNKLFIFSLLLIIGKLANFAGNA